MWLPLPNIPLWPFRTLYATSNFLFLLGNFLNVIFIDISAVSSVILHIMSIFVLTWDLSCFLSWYCTSKRLLKCTQAIKRCLEAYTVFRVCAAWVFVHKALVLANDQIFSKSSSAKKPTLDGEISEYVKRDQISPSEASSARIAKATLTPTSKLQTLRRNRQRDRTSVAKCTARSLLLKIHAICTNARRFWRR